MTLTLLWTDIMVWILVMALIAWGWVISRSPQVKKLWHTVFRSGIAMASATVLIVYLFFTLLDSVHLRLENNTAANENGKTQYGQMLSLLDMVFSHNIQHTERTYSAPFATHEYTKSIVVDEEGVTQQEYLPLKHVSKDSDMLKSSLLALMTGLIISLFLIFIHI